MKKTVNEMKAELNRLTAKIVAVEKNITSDNEVILMEEALNLFHGVGEGFRAKDYYAPDRYYSRIPGVKNIRFDGCSESIVVKIDSPVGLLLPSTVIVDGRRFSVEFNSSSLYNNEVNY